MLIPGNISSFHSPHKSRAEGAAIGRKLIEEDPFMTPTMGDGSKIRGSSEARDPFGTD